jgi:hypothetical protein
MKKFEPLKPNSIGRPLDPFKKLSMTHSSKFDKISFTAATPQLFRACFYGFIRAWESDFCTQPKNFD